MIASFVLLICSYNDGNWVSFGGAGAFIPHKTVRLLGEDINVTYTDAGIHVKVFFSFKNNGPATTVEMAFPFEDTQYSQSESFLNFVTTIDSVRVQVKKVSIPIVSNFFKSYGFDEQYKEFARPFAYVKSVHFEKNQTRHVLVEYDSAYGAAGGGWNLNEYILRTGATWAGTIGQCSITVDWTQSNEYSRPSLQFVRKDQSRFDNEWIFLSARKATTEFRNFEPEFDLDLTTIPGFFHFTLNGEPMGLDSGIAGAAGPVITGSPSDPLIASYGLEAFFWDGNYVADYFIPGAVPNAFGNYLEMRASSEIVDGFGKKHTLARNPNLGENDEYLWRVHIKDLVEALGGTFKWNTEWERIDLTMPTLKKPIRKPGDPIPKVIGK